MGMKNHKGCSGTKLKSAVLKILFYAVSWELGQYNFQSCERVGQWESLPDLLLCLRTFVFVGCVLTDPLISGIQDYVRYYFNWHSRRLRRRLQIFDLFFKLNWQTAAYSLVQPRHEWISIGEVESPCLNVFLPSIRFINILEFSQLESTRTKKRCLRYILPQT